MKKSLIPIAVALSLTAVPVLAKGGSPSSGRAAALKSQKSQVFLITGKLPHLTRQLMKRWDDPGLALTEDQKSRLLAVRERTIGAVQRLGREVAPLEEQVAAGVFSGMTPDDLEPVVRKIANLKAEATLVHLRCIYDTARILDRRQLDALRRKGP